MRKSLRVRLTVIFIGLAIGPLLLVGAFLTQQSFANERAEALQLQGQVAQSVASEGETFMSAVLNDLSLIGGNLRGVQTMDRTQALALLLDALNTGAFRDVYQEFTLLDAEGTEIVRLSRQEIVPSQDLGSLANSEEFKQVADTLEPYYSSSFQEPVSGDTVMTVAIPLRELRSVELSGVLVATISLEAGGGLLNAGQQSADQTIYVVDRSSEQIILHPDPALLFTDLAFPLSDDPAVESLADGTPVVVGTHTIDLGAQALTFVAERPRSIALAQARSTLLTVTVASLVALLVAGGLGFVIIRQVVTPIESLSDTAQSISEGDLERLAVVSGEDEINTLATSFNTMTSQLRQTITDERAARREAQEASRAKDLFLATMSHELRTPLNAIIGFLGLMLFSEQLNEDNAHMAERSLANSERLLSLINNILDLSRISAGNLEITPVSMSPLRMAEAIQQDMALQFKEKNLTFELHVDPDLPDPIMHDEERLVQIATNLLGNALKFTDQGSISLSINRRDDHLAIIVRDTGIGIPRAKQQLIFDEFVQVDGSSTRSHGGAGLGLAIVKRLAILMKGSVSVESETGKGSEFTVALPLSLEVAEDRLPQATPVLQ